MRCSQYETDAGRLKARYNNDITIALPKTTGHQPFALALVLNADTRGSM